MKHAKRIRALLLCALVLCATLALCACKPENPDASDSSQGTQLADGEALYKVTVVDGLGNPYTEKVIVKFMQDGAQVAMTNVNANGVAEKALTKGNYTVEITSTASGADCWYDPANISLTAEKTELEVVMAFAPGGEAQTLSANSAATGSVKDYEAYNVSIGSTYVKLDAEDRTYVLFTPTETGEYEVSVSGGSAEIGCYGSPHYVQAISTEEVVDNKFTMSIKAGMIGTGSTGTTTVVIGLDAKDGEEAVILNICRTGEAAWSIDQEPWITYQPSSEVTAYTLPEGTVLKDFDLTASSDAYKLVLNEQDGCYHLNAADGPAVFVQLDKAVYGISMKAMVGEIIYQDGVLMQSGTAPFRYMYDNGQDDFFKEDYTDAMRQYVTNRDKQSGVYPLNKDLHYMLTMGIDFMGWTRSDSSNYLFADVDGVNSEISWMFILCHANGEVPVPDNTEDPDNTQGTENPGTTTKPDNDTPGTTTKPDNNDNPGTTTKPDNNPGTTTKPDNNDTPGTTTKPDNTEKPVNKPIEDNKDAPILALPEQVGSGTLQFEAEVKANHIVYYDIPRVADTTLKISSGDAYVIYNGKTYEPKDGVVTIYNLVCDNWNPVSIAIGNKGTKDATFTVKLTYPGGHIMNPYTLKVGSNTTKIAEGNEMGLYYSFTPSKSGTLTINLDSITGADKCDIVITNESKNSKTVSLQEDGSDGKTVTMKVSSGDSITVIISVLPEDGFNYPAATIKTTVALN